MTIGGMHPVANINRKFDFSYKKCIISDIVKLFGGIMFFMLASIAYILTSPEMQEKENILLRLAWQQFHVLRVCD